ncbi:MAG: IS21 family transposase [Acidobacteriota bacterium]
MPARRLSMRRIREVLRLKFELGLENRQIARSCRISHSSVGNYLIRARRAGLSWPLPPDLDDEALRQRLFPPDEQPAETSRPLPDFASIHQELRRHKHVTLQLLWQEYKQVYPEGYQYSRYCELYARWKGKLDLVLRQDYRGGDKLFVDHAGQTIPLTDPRTGEIREAYLFVATLGASNYTYAEATAHRDLPSWIGSHDRALAFFGGVPTVVVPDNWKTGVTDPCFYDPDLNPTYRQWAEHYQTVVIPARVRKPKDKAKVENGVLVAERWILAALRKRTFFSISEVNQAVRERLVELNNRKFRKLDTTRARLFEEVDRPALKPLPAEPYPYRESKKVRVHPDYHVEIDRHYYSVPYHYVHEQLEAWIGEKTIEIFRCGLRVALHVRSFDVGRHTTLDEHRPPQHQNLQWTSDRMIRRGRAVGPAVAEVLERIMASRPHPELGYRSCLGVLRLGKQYTNERLEAACRRALSVNTCSYRSIRSILATGLDRQPVESATSSPAHDTVHTNVRGSSYYGSKEVRS